MSSPASQSPEQSESAKRVPRATPSRRSTAVSPLPPEKAAELLLAGRPEEEALATDSRIRCALTRLAVAVLSGRVDRGLANSATFIVNGIAQRLDQEAAKAARVRELELRAQEIETASRLTEALEAVRAQTSPALIQAVEVHVPALLREATATVQTSAPALKEDL